MKVNDVRKKARAAGVGAGKMKKADLIRAIQSAEGNVPCFGTALGGCDQIDCCWREDCLKPTSI